MIARRSFAGRPWWPGAAWLVFLQLFASPMHAGDAPILQAEVNLAELVEKPGVFEVTAIVHDARDGRFLGAPHMRFRGSETTTVSVATSGDDRLALTVGPVIGGYRAHWLVVLRRGGTILAKAKGTVRSQTAD